MINYIRSSNSITVLTNGIPFTMTKDAPQFDRLVSAVLDGDEDEVNAIANAGEDVKARLSIYGDVEVFAGYVKFQGQEIHNYLVDVILANEDPEPVGHFLNNVMQNPSRRATQDLYKWCEAARMPLTRDGCIIAYKLVTQDFKDIYTKTFDNSPGAVVEVPRNQVDEDPDRTCSHGLHFCSAGYLPHYGSSNSKVVLVKVNPADVVAFPTDYNLAKARCCKYEVIEEIDRNRLLPQTYGYYDEPEPAPKTYVIKDRDGDFVNFREDGKWSYDTISQTYDLETAQAYFDSYTGGFGPLQIVEAEEELVFIRDTSDGDYVVPDEDDDYHYTEDQPEPITRAAAEKLIADRNPDFWEIVPVSENDDWSVD